MPLYDRYYELEESLQLNSQLIPSPELYNFEDGKIYAAIMNRLAQPLPTGEESPFSAQTPGSAHSILVSNLVYLQSMIAHEFNLSADSTLLNHLRMLGTELRTSEYPILSVRFTLAEASDGAEIPANVEIRSIRDPGLSVYTLSSARITRPETSVVVPVRLSRLGVLPTIRNGEFSQIPRLLSNIDTAANEGIISPGKPTERLIDAVLRMRDWLKTGDRAVTDRDYHYFAMAETGAQKINVIRGLTPSVRGFARDLRTIAVYPGNLVQAVELALQSRKMADERLLVVPAEIIPVNGVIQVRAVSGLSDAEVFNLAAGAIAGGINPPFGKWGDREFSKSIGNTLERVQGIYAVPSVALKSVETNQPLVDIPIMPWSLLEVQQGTTIEVLR